MTYKEYLAMVRSATYQLPPHWLEPLKKDNSERYVKARSAILGSYAAPLNLPKPRTVVIRDTWSGAAIQLIVALILAVFALTFLYVADARAQIMYQGDGWRATAAVCQPVTRQCRLFHSPLYSSQYVCEYAAERARADLSRQYPQFRVIATCHASTREFGA